MLRKLILILFNFGVFLVLFREQESESLNPNVKLMVHHNVVLRNTTKVIDHDRPTSNKNTSKSSGDKDPKDPKDPKNPNEGHGNNNPQKNQTATDHENPKQNDTKGTSSNNTTSISKTHSKKHKIQPFQKTIDIYGASSFLIKGGIVTYTNARNRILCNISIDLHCKTYYFADMIDRMVAFAPVYYIRQDGWTKTLDLHNNFISNMKTVGIPTVVIEAIIESKNQEYKVTRPNNEPWEIQTTIEYAFYMRENLVNVACRKYREIWDYLLWIDAHHFFNNIYWWEEALWKMEHHSGVQLFDSLNEDFETNMSNPLAADIIPVIYKITYDRPFRGTRVWAGNAWGIRKEIYDELGYIQDTCIGASCDYTFVTGILKHPEDWDGMNGFPNYKKAMMPWIQKAWSVMKGNFGHVRGTVEHWRHEHLFDYWYHLSSLNMMDFNPDTDLMRDKDFKLHAKSDRIKNLFREVREPH